MKYSHMYVVVGGRFLQGYRPGQWRSPFERRGSCIILQGTTVAQSTLLAHQWVTVSKFEIQASPARLSHPLHGPRIHRANLWVIRRGQGEEDLCKSTQDHLQARISLMPMALYTAGFVLICFLSFPHILSTSSLSTIITAWP